MIYRFYNPKVPTRRTDEEWRRFKEDFRAKWERLKESGDGFSVQELDFLGNVLIQWDVWPCRFSSYSTWEDVLNSMPLGPILTWSLRLSD